VLLIVAVGVGVLGACTNDNGGAIVPSGTTTSAPAPTTAPNASTTAP
jgi:hypothetical protein